MLQPITTSTQIRVVVDRMVMDMIVVICFLSRTLYVVQLFSDSTPTWPFLPGLIVKEKWIVLNQTF